MIILGLAESFNTMNWPAPASPDPTVTLFDCLFIGKYKRKGREILTQLQFEKKIFNSLETMRFLAT